MGMRQGLAACTKMDRKLYFRTLDSCLRMTASSCEIMKIAMTCNRMINQEDRKQNTKRARCHQIKAVTSCSTHKIDQQETDG